MKKRELIYKSKKESRYIFIIRLPLKDFSSRRRKLYITWIDKRKVFFAKHIQVVPISSTESPQFTITLPEIWSETLPNLWK